MVNPADRTSKLRIVNSECTPLALQASIASPKLAYLVCISKVSVFQLPLNAYGLLLVHEATFHALSPLPFPPFLFMRQPTTPVLVVQADDYNQNAPTIIVAAVTSVIKKRYLPSHIILGEEFGLKKPSMVLLEQIRTVNREDLREYIGTVDDDKLFRQINATLKKTFGLWVYKPEGKENIRCLCPKCLNDYIHNPDYIVRRLDPFAKRKDRCDKCDGDGWDYVVTDRYSSKKEKRGSNDRK